MSRIFFLSFVVIWSFSGGPVFSQQSSLEASAEESPLGIRQLRIKRLLQELENRFDEIAEKIEGENPEEATRLRNALKELRERLLTQRIDDVADLLDSANLETASEEQKELIGEVKDLLTILLEEEDEAERRKREIEELEKWKAAIDKMIEREQDIRRESETTEDTKKATEKLAEEIEKLDELIDEQKELKEETEGAEGGLQKSDQLADDQEKLREKTEELSGDLDPEREPGEESEKPGAEKLKKAASEQAGAEENLKKSDSGKASENQKKALENMEGAKSDLEKEKERVEGLDTEARNKELSDEQKEEQENAGDLAQEMAESEQANEGEGSQQLQNSMENLKEAGKSMGKSAKKLGEQKPQEAQPDQEKALEDLKKAKEDVEERLADLKEEEKLEQLAKLEDIFRGILERQKVVTADTERIEEKRGAQEGELRRADRITLRKGSEEERSLAELSDETRNALAESDESVVFRDIVRYLSESLNQVADLLDRQESGEITLNSQKEIELTLEELIEALAAARNNPQAGKKQPPQEGQQGQMEQRMLPPSAELKLLKLSQLRVNRRTLDLNKAIGDKPELGAPLMEQLDDLAAFQRRLAIMAREIGARANLTAEDVD